MKTKKTTKQKEQTVVLTIQATYILKGKDCLTPSTMDRPLENFPIEVLDLNVCPNADHTEITKIKVFEKE
jgi:hypothetical protein